MSELAGDLGGPLVPTGKVMNHYNSRIPSGRGGTCVVCLAAVAIEALELDRIGLNTTNPHVSLLSFDRWSAASVSRSTTFYRFDTLSQTRQYFAAPLLSAPQTSETATNAWSRANPRGTGASTHRLD